MLSGSQLTGFNVSTQQGNDGNTALLLHCDGADTSTSFPDSGVGGASGTGSHTITANGNAQVDTAQSVFGGASLLCDGTGDYTNADGDSDLAFGTGPFTIDFRFRMNGDTDLSPVDFRPAATQGLYPTLYVSGTLRYFTDSADRITGTTNFVVNTWYHIAVTRDGTSTRMFVDGAQEGSTYTDSNSYLVGANRPTFGILGFDAVSLPLDGWMDEIRISNVARWTANFTPPEAPHS